nr:phosphatidylglycerol lysyltransferase domain-containing protein [Actinomadura coerulea]
MDGASWLPGVLGLAGAAGLLVLVITLLAPDPAPPPGDEAERVRVAGLVLHPGSDTLAPFALRRDKAYVFSADGRAAIGYRVLFGMAVAGGDPVGDPASHADAVRAFLAMCRTTGWRPAVLGASDALLPAWGPCRSIGFGDEVVIRPAEFTLSGRKMRNVRQAVRRTENFGVSSEILPERELTPVLRAKLLDVASRSLGGAAERGFSMNLDELLTGYHPGAIVAVAYDEDKEPIAFQRYVTAGEGVSLDAMRRAPGGPNGVNERLIVEMVEYAAAHGHGLVSLNFAAFRELLDAGERGLLEKAGYRALHLLDPWIAVESLYLFDKKFRPSYKPRSVVFRSWFDIAWLAAALLTLEFGRTRPAQRAAGPITEPVHHLGPS